MPMVLNRRVSYKNIKFNNRNEFDKLRLMIDRLFMIILPTFS